MCCGCCVHINWCCVNCTDIIHLYVSCMHLWLFSLLVLYSKASGSKPTPLTESNFMKWDLCNSCSLHPRWTTGATQPSTLPVSVLAWQVLGASLLLQSACRKLPGKTDITQGGELLLVLQHSLHSILDVLCRVGPVTYFQKHQVTSVPLAFTLFYPQY